MLKLSEFASLLLLAYLLVPSSPPLSLPLRISKIVFSSPLRGRGEASREGGAALGAATMRKLARPLPLSTLLETRKECGFGRTWPNCSPYSRLLIFGMRPPVQVLAPFLKDLPEERGLLRGNGERGGQRNVSLLEKQSLRHCKH